MGSLNNKKIKFFKKLTTRILLNRYFRVKKSNKPPNIKNNVLKHLKRQQEMTKLEKIKSSNESSRVLVLNNLDGALVQNNKFFDESDYTISSKKQINVAQLESITYPTTFLFFYFNSIDEMITTICFIFLIIYTMIATNDYIFYSFLLYMFYRIEVRLSDLQIRVANIERRLTALERAVERLERRVESLEGRVEALEGRVEALEGNEDEEQGEEVVGIEPVLFNGFGRDRRHRRLNGFGRDLRRRQRRIR
ncbi:hypothetical protein ACQ4LE_009540 [Meloidogyne hapla]